MTRSIFPPYSPNTIGRLKKERRPGTKFNRKLLQRVILEPMDSDTLNRYISSIFIDRCRIMQKRYGKEAASRNKVDDIIE